MGKKVAVALCLFMLALGLTAVSSADICNGASSCGGGGGGHHGSGGGGLPGSAGPTLVISNAVFAPGQQAPSIHPGGHTTEVFEGDACKFTVKLKNSNKPASGHWATLDGSARGCFKGCDYLDDEGDFEIDPRENPKYTILIQTVHDIHPDEGDESFFVVLSNAKNAVIGDGKGKCVIHEPSN